MKVNGVLFLLFKGNHDYLLHIYLLISQFILEYYDHSVIYIYICPQFITIDIASDEVIRC